MAGKENVRGSIWICGRILLFVSVADVGQQCNLTGTLDGDCELALMSRACSGHSAGKDLSSLGDELAELSRILVIDDCISLCAEGADFPAALLTVVGLALRTLGVFLTCCRTLFGSIFCCLDGDFHVILHF